MSTRRVYTAEFKREAIGLLETSGKSAAQIERDLGIGAGCLSRWRLEQMDNAEDAFPGHGRPAPEQDRLRELERENQILRQERDILHVPWRAALALCASTCVPGKKAVATPWLSRTQADEVPVHRGAPR
jgi:transposase